MFYNCKRSKSNSEILTVESLEGTCIRLKRFSQLSLKLEPKMFFPTGLMTFYCLIPIFFKRMLTCTFSFKSFPVLKFFIQFIQTVDLSLLLLGQVSKYTDLVPWRVVMKQHTVALENHSSREIFIDNEMKILLAEEQLR